MSIIVNRILQGGGHRPRFLVDWYSDLFSRTHPPSPFKWFVFFVDSRYDSNGMAILMIWLFQPWTHKTHFEWENALVMAIEFYEPLHFASKNLQILVKSSNCIFGMDLIWYAREYITGVDITWTLCVAFSGTIVRMVSGEQSRKPREKCHPEHTGRSVNARLLQPIFEPKCVHVQHPRQ